MFFQKPEGTFVLGFVRVQISARRPVILPKNFRDFHQYLPRKRRDSSSYKTTTVSFHNHSYSLIADRANIRRYVTQAVENNARKPINKGAVALVLD
jgi:hypothetical protein